jgi:glycosyltransferase involved in cell wall biosynthesis
MQKTPKLSILMPTYNNSAYLAEAIDSILGQTFTNFEFLIVDDGSTDASPQILADYAAKDSRIRIIRNEVNQKIAASLNHGLNEARADLIARMDSDDVSLPFRLEKQVAFMDAQPDVIVSGGHFKEYETNIVVNKPLTNEAIRIFMLWGTPFSHSTTILRRVPCLQAGGYSQAFSVHEDSDFWRRLALLPAWRFANLDEILIRHREHPHADRSAYRALQLEQGAASIKAFLLAIGIPENELDMEAHLVLANRAAPSSVPIKRVHAWSDRLIQLNLEANFFDSQALADSCLQQLHNAYVKAHWLPAGLKRLIPIQIKRWIKKGIFSLKQCLTA